MLNEALSPALCLERLPKSHIDVYVQILESDGTNASLAAGITCASMALADAGIEMLDLVTACASVR